MRLRRSICNNYAHLLKKLTIRAEPCPMLYWCVMLVNTTFPGGLRSGWASSWGLWSYSTSTYWAELADDWNGSLLCLAFVCNLCNRRFCSAGEAIVMHFGTQDFRNKCADHAQWNCHKYLYTKAFFRREYYTNLMILCGTRVPSCKSIAARFYFDISKKTWYENTVFAKLKFFKAKTIRKELLLIRNY